MAHVNRPSCPLASSTIASARAYNHASNEGLSQNRYIIMHVAPLTSSRKPVVTILPWYRCMGRGFLVQAYNVRLC